MVLIWTCVGRYSAHLRRQASDLSLFTADESLLLNPELDYQSIDGLSSEILERLRVVRPGSIVSCPFVGVASDECRLIWCV
jgi:tRNA U34 5-carboxymethylaminomethyl modifying enzyme MnmG/GidA